MKYLFLILLAIIGLQSFSLHKCKCDGQVETVYFLKKKRVHVDVRKESNIVGIDSKICGLHEKNQTIIFDSVTIKAK